MNHINFLSDEFMRELDRRRRLFREIVFIVIVVLTLGAWGLTTWRGIESLDAQLQVRQEEASDLKTHATQYEKLAAQHTHLQNRMRIKQELVLPINLTSVIATIGQLMPDALTVQEFKIDATAPTPRPKVDPSKKTKTTAKKKKVVKQVMHIHIVGLSPDDKSVADFEEKLTHHNVFGTIKLRYTRPKSVLKRSARMFCIDIEVPLDRLYEPTSQESQELAHAS